MTTLYVAEAALLQLLRERMPEADIHPAIPADAAGPAIGFQHNSGRPVFQRPDSMGSGSSRVWDEHVYQVCVVAPGSTLSVVEHLASEIDKALMPVCGLEVASGGIVHQVTLDAPLRMSYLGEDGLLRQVAGGFYRLKVTVDPLS